MQIKLNNEITIGVVYNPAAKKLFSAVKGCGAQLNNKAINPSQTKKLGNALLNKNYFHVIGRFKLSNWNGADRVQIFIEDLIEL